MRAKTKIYHIECFRCTACAKQLIPGDEFALRDGGLLYCKEDHDVMEKTSAPTTPHPGQESNNNTSLSNNNHSNNSTELGCMSGNLEGFLFVKLCIISIPTNSFENLAIAIISVNQMRKAAICSITAKEREENMKDFFFTVEINN